MHIILILYSKWTIETIKYKGICCIGKKSTSRGNASIRLYGLDLTKNV